jgi:peptidyl-prolyl cis-trans isomerase D
MLRTMRSNAKWIFYILAIAFIGWLAVGQVMSILGPSGNVVLRVNRKEYPVTEYQQRVQNASEQYRQQYGTAPTTKEEDRQLQDQVISQMVQDALLEQEYQTDGQPDIRKWQQFLATTSDRNLLLQLEGVYRQQIPRLKLFEYLASDVYIPDTKLWRLYKDQHDSVRVAVIAVSPYTTIDTTPIPDAELQAYIAKHPDDFKRPAVASVRFIAIPRLPDAADSAVARAHVARVRGELTRGAKFEAVAKKESSDSSSGQRGGELGWIKRTDSTFVAPFMQAVRNLKPGQLSAPVESQFGYHLIRIDQAKGDSVKVRHILIPVPLQGAHLDQVETRVDTLERLAAERSDPTTIETVGSRMGLPLSPEYKVVEGQGFRIGDYRIPDVSVWAFETTVGETSPVIEGDAAYYVFRLDSVTPAGTPPLALIRARVSDLVRVEKLKTLAHHRADSLAALLKGVPDLASAAAARGIPVQRLGPFTRMRPPRDLTGEPFVVGTAFGLRVGERSGVLEGENGYFILESLGRRLADSTAWLAQREVQRTQLRQALQQARIQQYLEGVRAKAKIVDRRKDVFKSQASADASTLLQ